MQIHVLVTILENLDVPTVGFEALHDVLGEGDVGFAVDGDVYGKKCSEPVQSSCGGILTVVVVQLETRTSVSSIMYPI